MTIPVTACLSNINEKEDDKFLSVQTVAEIEAI
jgi:hypothetical protein